MTLSPSSPAASDFKTADSIFVWKADTAPDPRVTTPTTCSTGAPSQPALLRWVKVGDAPGRLPGRGDPPLGNRSVFIRTKAELPSYIVSESMDPLTHQLLHLV